MIITSSEPKDNFGRSRKRLIKSLGIKDKVSIKKYKKARYSIKNVSIKDLSKIIREFEKLPDESYERRRPKHMPTGSYFYLSGQLAKCMMISDALNSDNYPVRTETAGAKQNPISQVCSADDNKLK